MRVAVSQFATTSNTQENLATCLRMIDEVAECQPTLIVLPEYCNTLPYYIDQNQAWNEALSIEGSFLLQIAEQAKKHSCYIMISVTLRQDALRTHKNGSIRSNISVTSCLFSPFGELIHQTDKSILSEQESEFFICGNKAVAVVKTQLGKLGFLSGNDSLNYNASRELALSGAQLLCNAINSSVLDQSAFHEPTRACENRVFIATANKVGALVPEFQLKKYTSSAQHSDTLTQSFNPQTTLVGVGQSQILSPDGKVLAKMENSDEGYIFADIDLAHTEKQVGINNKFRPDGTQVIKQLRPELYRKLGLQAASPVHEYDKSIPKTANVAIFATYKSNEEAVEDVCHYIENNLSDIIQLPELFFITDKTITNNADELAQIEYACEQLIIRISAVLRPYQYVCTSLVIEGAHQAVIISADGLLATQQQLHFCKRYQWTALGNALNIIELPLEQGRIFVAMLTADDANIPEMVQIAAQKGIHLLLVPFDIQESCEVEYNLLTYAAENRVCIIAGSREKVFSNELYVSNSLNVTREQSIHSSQSKTKPRKSTGLIVNLVCDLSSLPQWKPRKQNGYYNQPITKHQYGKITKAVIHPIAACNKLVATKSQSN